MHTQSKNKWLLPLGAFAGLFLVAGLATARGPGWMGRDDAKAMKFASYMVDDVLDDLDATDDQRDEVHAIKARLFKKAVAMKADKEKTREEVKAILASDNPDGERLHAIVDNKSQEMTKLAHEVADAALELHDVLDEEQREELAEIIARHEGKRRRWH
jgi:Spy/CpxP family protein refolding chaperone